MAKQIYFIVMDKTKKREDPKQMYFLNTGALNDIAGYLVGIARKEQTPVEDMRLFVAPDKKTWDRMYHDYLNRVNF